MVVEHGHDRFLKENKDPYMSDGLNLLHPRKDMAEMVIVFCVSPIVPEGLVLWTWNEQVIEKKK